MPGLVGRDPKEAFSQFRDHLAALLNKTVTDARLSLVHLYGRDRAQISFRENNEAIVAPLRNVNDLFLYIGQTLRVSQQPDKTWKLRTTEYRYRIQGTQDIKDDDCLRWEYVSREVRDNAYCRHHLHLQGDYELGDRRRVPLADVHIPTGWVTVEEIIRFMITDLKVPSKSGDWEKLLCDSEAQFRAWTSRDI